MAIFINITANFNTQSAEVTEDPIILGRSSTCDIKIDDGMVSGKHISFKIDAGKIMAEDLDTTNGSFINGHALSKSLFTLKDEIKIGEIIITLDKSKMSVKEIFSHKGRGGDDSKSSPLSKPSAAKSTVATGEPDLPEKGPESQIDDKKSLSGLIKNAKVAQLDKKKGQESTSSTSVMPKFITDEDDKKEKKEKNLAGKLKGFFKKK